MRKPTVIVVLLGISFVLGSCLVGSLIFWMMLGSPWPIDLSAFAE